jgi:hypothetical protein
LKTTIEVTAEELERISRPRVTGDAIFYAYVCVIIVLIAFLWIDELMLMAIPSGLGLFYCLYSTKEWAREKVRWHELEREVMYLVRVGRLSESIEEYDKMYSEYNKKLKQWAEKPPNLIERTVLQWSTRKEYQNIKLKRSMEDFRYMLNRLNEERERLNHNNIGLNDILGFHKAQ